jgi:sugar lactone lactonase YvrE
VEEANSGLARRLIQRILRYGEGEGELGFVPAHGQPAVGPESFALDRNGNILVADRVNRRVVFCGPGGAYLRSIEIPSVNLNDVVADRQGGFCVFDQATRSLHHYDATGATKNVLQLSPADVDTRGYFHIADDAIYFADAAARDVLVASLKNGMLGAPDPTTGRTSQGIHADSGRVYCVSVARGEGLQVRVAHPAVQPAEEEQKVAMPDILSARFVGEDEARRFYVQVERLAGRGVILEVLVFGPAGERLGAVRIPENDYAIWTTKLLEVGANGAIVQFLPGESEARLNLFLE